MQLVSNFKNAVYTSLIKNQSKEKMLIQERTLFERLNFSKNTYIGKKYDFASIKSLEDYRKKVPIHHYEDISKYWEREIKGEKNITVSEDINFYALSTGTTGTAKYIPVTSVVVNSNKLCQKRLAANFLRKNPNSNFLDKKLLSITGCSRVGTLENGANYGMISGYIVEQAPFFLRNKFIPSDEILHLKNWEERLPKIIEEARGKKIGALCGIPSSVISLLERMKETYTTSEFEYFANNLETVFASGVNYRLLQKSFDSLLEGRKIQFSEFYAASEGIFALNSYLDSNFLELSLDTVFFEFIPFNIYLEKNYSERLFINEVKENEEYVILVTSGNGAFSYVLGDVIEFEDVANCLIKIKGRTALTLNLAGEKTSISAIEKSVSDVASAIASEPGEFFVTSKVKDGKKPGYLWVFEQKDKWNINNVNMLKDKLEKAITENNDYYKHFEKSGLSEIDIEFVSGEKFTNWLESKSADKGHTKIPKILLNQNIVNQILN